MSLSTAELAATATWRAGRIAEESLHSADPGPSGTANESTAARQPVTATASGAVTTIPSASFTGGAASGAATWVAVWDGSGNFIASSQADAGSDQAFNAAGEADVASWTITES